MDHNGTGYFYIADKNNDGAYKPTHPNMLDNHTMISGALQKANGTAGDAFTLKVGTKTHEFVGRSSAVVKDLTTADAKLYIESIPELNAAKNNGYNLTVAVLYNKTDAADSAGTGTVKEAKTVFVTKAVKSGTTTDPDPDPTPTPTGDYWADMSARNAIKVYYKDGVTFNVDDGAAQLLSQIPTGETVTSNVDDGTKVTITTTKGTATKTYVWNYGTSTNNIEAYVGTVNGKTVWIDKTANTNNPQLINANLKGPQTVTMVGTKGKVVTGTGLTGTPAANSYVAIASTGVVVTGNGFNVNSGYVGISGAGLAANTVIPVNQNYTIPAKSALTGTNGSSVDGSTGVKYTINGVDKYAAYSTGIIPAAEITGAYDITLDADYITVTITPPAGYTVASTSTTYIECAAAQSITINLTHGTPDSTKTGVTATGTQYSISGGVTVAAADVTSGTYSGTTGATALVIPAVNAASATGNITVNIASIVLAP